MAMILALCSLFAAAFVAATIVPFQSEVIFIGLQLAKAAPLWLLVLVASVGNTLGAGINYAIGRGITRYENRKWFPATPAQMQRATGWFQKWGVWVLLLSWAPVGDVMTLVAGVMRTPLWLFWLLVGIAKTSRYLALAWITARLAAG